jgi:hypothetical protein
LESCEAVEYTFHRIDVSEIQPDVVIATPLATNQSKPASCIVVAGYRTAEVYHRGQLLLLFQRDSGHSVPLESGSDTPVEVGRCEFDGVTRHHSRIQAVKPA